MKNLQQLTSYNIKIILRSRLFWPAILFNLVVFLLALEISQWSIAEMEKIYFDIGYGVLSLASKFLALLWGITSLVDSRSNGSLEIDLSAPISREELIVSRFLSLGVTLLSYVALSCLPLFAFASTISNFEYHGTTLLLIVACSWILSALGLFLGSVTNLTLALAGGLILTFVGISAPSLIQILPADSSAFLRHTLSTLALFWNLETFQFDSISMAEPQTFSMIFNKLLYSLVLSGAFIAASVLTFRSKDVRTGDL